jgi:hypothetical protein
MVKKGQSIIEYTVVFAIAIILMSAMVSLWSWSLAHLSQREGAFEGTRTQAGKKASPGVPEVPLNS